MEKLKLHIKENMLHVTEMLQMENDLIVDTSGKADKVEEDKESKEEKEPSKKKAKEEKKNVSSLSKKENVKVIDNPEIKQIEKK